MGDLKSIIMQRTLIINTTKKINQKIKIKGWAQSIRQHGKISFLDISDRSATVQVIFEGKLMELKEQYTVSVEGIVKERPVKLINTKLKTGKLEIEAKKIKILSKSKTLPFDMGSENLNISLPTLLDYQPLTLRHYKNRAIFKIQSEIAQSFRKTMQKMGFTEFNGPTIVPVATEGGAEVFKIQYFNHNAYLAQSPQLYKQIMVGVFERVFTITHAFRAEPSTTTRHICEYITMDAEMGFINSYKDLMDIVEKVFKNIFADLRKNYSRELKIHSAKELKIKKSIPRLRLSEAQEIIFQRTGRDNRKKMDLEPEDEREICVWAKEKHNCELVFITHYPTKKRPFYTYPDPKNPDLTLSFDLLFRGLEVVTGGRRINNYAKLLKNIKKWGNKPKDFKFYLHAFKYGMPPEGGFAIGLERITKQVLGLENIRSATLFPRDMERIDMRLEKKNYKKQNK